MDKKNKLCAVRMPEKLHSEVKSLAYRKGMTLQSYIISILEINLFSEKKDSRTWKCQDCGSWSLTGTQMARLGECQKCGKKEVATFPCEDMR